MYPLPGCVNRNPVFDSNSYDSKEYKTELIRLLKLSEDGETKFWFSKYLDSNHILISIQNDKICAEGHFTVKKWEGFMEHLKEVEGVSYGGPLIGLEYELVEDEHRPEIVLINVEGIID